MNDEIIKLTNKINQLNTKLEGLKKDKKDKENEEKVIKFLTQMKSIMEICDIKKFTIEFPAQIFNNLIYDYKAWLIFQSMQSKFDGLKIDCYSEYSELNCFEINKVDIKLKYY